MEFIATPNNNSDAKLRTLPNIELGPDNTFDLILPIDLPKDDDADLSLASLFFLSAIFLLILFLLLEIDLNCDLKVENIPWIFSATEFNSFALSSTAIMQYPP